MTYMQYLLLSNSIFGKTNVPMHVSSVSILIYYIFIIYHTYIKHFLEKEIRNSINSKAKHISKTKLIAILYFQLL